MKRRIRFSFHHRTPNVHREPCLRNILSWLVKKENEKKVKMHSTVLNSFDGPMITMHSTLNTLNSLVEEMSGQADYKICNNDHGFSFSFRYRTQFPLLTYNVAT